MYFLFTAVPANSCELQDEDCHHAPGKCYFSCIFNWLSGKFFCLNDSMTIVKSKTRSHNEILDTPLQVKSLLL